MLVDRRSRRLADLASHLQNYFFAAFYFSSFEFPLSVCRDDCPAKQVPN